MSEGEREFLRLIDDYGEASFSTMLKKDDYYETIAERLEDKGLVKIRKRYRGTHHDMRDRLYVARLNSQGEDVVEVLRMVPRNTFKGKGGW